VHRLENKPIDIPRVMIPALDAVSIQIQTRIAGRRVRRAKQVVEIIGLDPHTTELLTNEVFRWIPATDEYEFSGKSYVLEKIMVKANMSKQQIMQELMSRKEVLEWLVENKIRKHQEVSKVIAEYYLRPEQVLSRVRSSTGGQRPAASQVSVSAPSLAPATAPRPPQGQPAAQPAAGTLKANLQQAALPPAGGTVGGGQQSLHNAGKVCPTCRMNLAANATQCTNCGERV